MTGGTGFIGQHVIRKLLQRGYEVNALARSSSSVAKLAAMGVHVVHGDITDVASMRPGMEGCDVVFHIAAWYKLGDPNWHEAEAVNVGGTRKVLRLAYELGIPKIVYTSTVAVFGDTKGQLVDENFFQGGPFLTEYDRTKWLAHYKVAVPLIEKGAPIMIVMPGGVYGPGDTSVQAEMMRLFYRGLPVLPAPNTTLTYAHVEDIAEGHILAAERGKVGESYVLAGPAIPLSEMVEFWSHLTGKPAPKLQIPAETLRPFAPLGGVISKVMPYGAFTEEGIRSLGVTYMARSDKARAQLGWTTRPLQTGMKETFDWIIRTEPQQTPSPLGDNQKQIATLALVAAAVLLVWWLFGRRRT